jgi:hypothetical protein
MIPSFNENDDIKKVENFINLMNSQSMDRAIID